jgi:putative inorganic carbon (hco3(-)) transporter
VRDLALTAFILGSLPFVLRKPQLGVILYVWISVMNPHRLTWSFAYEFNFAALVAIATLIGTLFSKEARRPPLNAPMCALILFAVWVSLTTIFALHGDLSYSRWESLMKTLLMAFLIPMLFHKKEDLRLLTWVLALSIAYYGTKGGIWTLATGGAARVYGPAGSYIEDNNAVAVAIVMIVPMLRFLQLTSKHRYVRWSLIVMMLCCGVAVLGTYSRGALLAVCAMAAFFWWKGRHKLPILLTVLLVVSLALSTMPDKWFERMETIKTYDQDSSASMRLNAWKTMWNVAVDRPIFGGGFELATREIYARYSPDASFPPQVAHSIYFQAMGEHGFVGLGLYLLLFAALWRKTRTIIRAIAAKPELVWVRELLLMMQVAFVGFAVGGAFLSLVNYDVPYYLVAIAVASVAIAERHLKERPVPASRREVDQTLLRPLAGHSR